ncbi:TPA: hypothetical protein RF372_000472 [Listeria monocytogenes]|uniref:Lin1272 protein n=1 Tax=Listeria innocua serovar 6a (strain ATCC BAA-680 / CLIP 11262) TaxID=272626 RepID=Q92CB7_LISIN|nr:MULTISPECIES: YqbF domain-containing protein [Listeria]EAE5608369.1 hypothetical protein [Listeria monocytogenes]EAE9977162.1 hypothetical protein [Listeria monocytogenes]EAE9987790.1 hypothetical protein [Listeria monocytogenes]EAE9989476.1 hypothetical protein [Listeria monocytogenes]EAE9991979.1 hypothetical protein [Listeria monocytogenes]
MSKYKAMLTKGEHYVLLPQNILFKKDIPVDINEEIVNILQDAEEFLVTEETSEKTEETSEVKKAKKSSKD